MSVTVARHRHQMSYEHPIVSGTFERFGGQLATIGECHCGTVIVQFTTDGRAPAGNRAAFLPMTRVVLGDVHGPALPALPIGTRVRVVEDGRTGTVVAGTLWAASVGDPGDRVVQLDTDREPTVWDGYFLAPLDEADDVAAIGATAARVAEAAFLAVTFAETRAHILALAFYADNPSAVELLADYRDAHADATARMSALDAVTRAARAAGADGWLHDVAVERVQERQALTEAAARVRPLALLLDDPAWHAAR